MNKFIKATEIRIRQHELWEEVNSDFKRFKNSTDKRIRKLMLRTMTALGPILGLIS